jgi:protocatechuate 3,4-dioxygenase beta subunit
MSTTAAPPDYEGRPLAHPDEPVFDQGLQFDVETLVGRRAVLKMLGFTGLSAGLLTIVGCNAAGVSPSAAATALLSGPSASASAAVASAPSAGASATASAPSSAIAATDCATVIPEETAGPFPGDGSNGPDVLSVSGIVRTDITKSIGANGVAAGVPLTIRLAIQDVDKACAPIAGAAVYLWHCDREGRYSMYSPGVTGENYLRGVAATDANGVATFTSIYPGCYSGRWPHVHFEVYPSLASATDPANVIATSQIALPEDACHTVYATDGYSDSVRNLSGVTLQTDMVFGDDGGVHELGTVTGDVTNGMTVTLAVPVRT